jgi:hypothetical protein
MKALARYPRFFLWLIGMLTAAVMSGCGGGGSTTPPGTLGVSLTDAPACGFDAVNVTVNKVRTHQSGSASDGDAGWSEVTLNPPRKINLLDLTNGVLTSLGETQLPAGHYTQLRLVLDDNTGQTVANSVVLTGTTTEIPLSTPSATQSGFKLIHQFDVPAGQRTDLLLDFDACKSVVTRGSGAYSLMPVVGVIPFTLNGIKGFVSTSLLTSNVAVTAQSNGTVIRSTVPNAQTGEFTLARLDPGNYDVVITADNRATAVITGVPVQSAAIVNVSSSTAPINLTASTMRNASGTVTLAPPSPTVAPFVAARQTLGTTTVTVKSKSADLISGAYQLALPAAAPSLGAYGTGTLPITLNPQTAAAGKYTMLVTATGYQQQSTSADIATTDFSANFQLTQ